MKKEEKLLHKIRLILAKANDPSVDEIEANTFMAKANKMLLEHNLSMSQVKAGEKMNIRHEQSAFGYGKMYIEGNSWERTLLAIICQANLCDSVITPSEKTMHIIGRPDNVESVMYMYEVARDIFRRMSRERYNAHKKEILDEHDTGLYKRVELAKMLEQQKLLTYRTTFIQAYLKGAVIGLHSKLTLDRMQAEADDRSDLSRRSQDGEDITAIVPLSTQLSKLAEECKSEIEEFKKEEYGDLGNSKKMRVDKESEITQLGYEDGKNTNLVKGVETTVDRQTVKQISDGNS